MRCFGTAIWLSSFIALALAATGVNATDLLLLQQAVLPEEAARVQLLVDRGRVVVAELRKEAKPPYLVQITLEGQPPIVLNVRCQDIAGAKQVLDALRPRGLANLDLSGRCWF